MCGPLESWPTTVGIPQLNLCTMVVTVVDMFDALRGIRVYREGMRPLASRRSCSNRMVPPSIARCFGVS